MPWSSSSPSGCRRSSANGRTTSPSPSPSPATARRSRRTRARRSGASRNPRSARRATPSSTAFSALLFIPGMKPFQAVEGERESRVRLHVRRMFITDGAGLLPPWLRFVHGVVDPEDLPLNVSREMLQSTPALARIRKAVTARVLSELKARAKDPEDYAKFWENFGPVLKEGVWEDAEHRQEL